MTAEELDDGLGHDGAAPVWTAFADLMAGLLGAFVLILVGACVLFPRVLAFVELAARELRYFWWLILIAAIGVWLVFFHKSRKP